MAVVTEAMVTAATGMVITVVMGATAMEVTVTAMAGTDTAATTDMVIGMAKGTGMDTATVTATGGMVAGGPTGLAPVGDWCPVAGSGFATEPH